MKRSTNRCTVPLAVVILLALALIQVLTGQAAWAQPWQPRVMREYVRTLTRGHPPYAPARHGLHCHDEAMEMHWQSEVVNFHAPLVGDSAFSVRAGTILYFVPVEKGDAKCVVDILLHDMFVVPDERVDPQRVKELSQNLDALRGIVVRAEFNRVGQGRWLDWPEGLAPGPNAAFRELTHGLEALIALPLPPEPIGVGAIWEVRSATRLGPLPATRHGEVTLRENKDGHLVLSERIRWLTEVSELPNPAGGHPIEVISPTYSEAQVGHARIERDLLHLLPTRAVAKHRAEFKLELERHVEAANPDDDVAKHAHAFLIVSMKEEMLGKPFIPVGPPKVIEAGAAK